MDPGACLIRLLNLASAEKLTGVPKVLCAYLLAEQIGSYVLGALKSAAVDVLSCLEKKADLEYDKLMLLPRSTDQATIIIDGAALHQSAAHGVLCTCTRS